MDLLKRDVTADLKNGYSHVIVPDATAASGYRSKRFRADTSFVNRGVLEGNNALNAAPYHVYNTNASTAGLPSEAEKTGVLRAYGSTDIELLYETITANTFQIWGCKKTSGTWGNWLLINGSGLTNVIANRGVGLDQNLPTTFSIGDVYVASDTRLIYTVGTDNAWYSEPLQTGQLITDTSGTLDTHQLLQYDGLNIVPIENSHVPWPDLSETGDANIDLSGLDFNIYGQGNFTVDVSSGLVILKNSTTPASTSSLTLSDAEAKLAITGNNYPTIGVNANSVWANINGTGFTISDIDIILSAGAHYAHYDIDYSSLTVGDNHIPSAKWIRARIDEKVAGSLSYRGPYDAFGETYPVTGGSGLAGAILKGDFFIISVPGLSLQVGDYLIANTDNPGQTPANWDTLNTNISYTPEDLANKEDTTLDLSSIKYPTNRLVREYVDNLEFLPAAAQGNVLYHNGTQWVPLAVGADGQVLTTHGVSQIPTWETVALPVQATELDPGISKVATQAITNLGVNDTDYLTPLKMATYLDTNFDALPAGSHGTILYHNGTSWVPLAVGTDGQVLMTHGADLSPTWEAVSPVSVPGIADVLAQDQVIAVNEKITIDSRTFDIQRIEGNKTSLLRVGGLGASAGIYYIDSDTGTSSTVVVSFQSTSLSHWPTSAGGMILDLHANDGVKLYDAVHSRGFIYAADYWANATERTIIDKGNTLKLIPLTITPFNEQTGITTLDNSSNYQKFIVKNGQTINAVRLMVDGITAANGITVKLYDAGGNEITDAVGITTPNVQSGLHMITIALGAEVTLSGSSLYWLGLHQATGAGANFVSMDGARASTSWNTAVAASGLAVAVPTGVATPNRICAELIHI